jgi:hydroxyacylglutathione hydrolase
MQIVPVPCLADNYAYLLISPDGRGAAVVDPSEPGPVRAALEERSLHLLAILCTHHHYDHVGGNEELLSAFGPLPVYGHESDKERGRIPGQTVGLADGQGLEVLGARATALYIPGHTMGAVAYYFPAEGVVFTGDTLFGGGCGRLFEGTPALMHASLSRLAALPGETHVYCGHEYTEKNLLFAALVEPENEAIRERQERVRAARAAGRPSVPSTMAEELVTNPFLRVHQAAVAAAAAKREPNAAAGQAEVFGAIRRWKDVA